jgi:hypothetical protein
MTVVSLDMAYRSFREGTKSQGARFKSGGGLRWVSKRYRMEPIVEELTSVIGHADRAVPLGRLTEYVGGKITCPA